MKEAVHPIIPPRRRRVLFVCVGNSCRSPMAEALARHLAADVIEPQSAGISPLGNVASATRRALLAAASLIAIDLIINMSGIPGGSLFPNSRVEDWDVEDPYGEDMETYARICEDIEARVLSLAGRLRGPSAT